MAASQSGTDDRRHRDTGGDSYFIENHFDACVIKDVVMSVKRLERLDDCFTVQEELGWYSACVPASRSLTYTRSRTHSRLSYAA